MLNHVLKKLNPMFVFVKGDVHSRCTRHATRGSLEVTMLGGMGGQRFTKRSFKGPLLC